MSKAIKVLDIFRKPAPIPASWLLDPFNSTDDVISHHIVGIHDSQATKYEVDSVYTVLANIIKSSTHTGERLQQKRPRTSIELVEDKVPSFMPSFYTLKEIACQMTCKSVDAFTAHETIVWILEKLRNYTWDAKAIIVLAAFTLDYGEPWRLSLMQATKEGSLEFHVLRLAGMEKPSDVILSDFNTLVDPALQLINGIIELEKLISGQTYSPKEVPVLYNVQRETYTYWAIFALMACSCRAAESDWKFKSEVTRRLSIVLGHLNIIQKAIKDQIEAIEDYKWRLTIFHTPSGILELLKALLYPKDVKQYEIFDGTAKKLVSAEVLKTMNVLLFISGLDNIDDEIWILKAIHKGFITEKDKQNYRILWVPVVDNWREEVKIKFDELKSKMPWYTVQYFSPIGGIKLLQQEWHYQGKPIVVVTDPRGQVINQNAMHLIFVWGLRAFPFRPDVGETLFQHWDWFWNAAKQLHLDIGRWTQDDKFIFFYGGTETQKFGAGVENIKKDPIIKKADASIEHFCLTNVDTTKFWQNITNSFLCKVQQDKYKFDKTFDVMTFLSIKNEKGWALLSRGENILLLGSDLIMTKVVEEFGNWKTKVEELQGFDNAFIDYYRVKSTEVPRQCSHLHLNNIRSEIPSTIRCPNPSCGLSMEIESINYKCCHGEHHA